LVSSQAKEAVISVTGTFTLRDPDTRKVFYTGADSAVTINCNRISLPEGKVFSQKKCLVEADNPDGLVLNGRGFRGVLFFAVSASGLRIINSVELEDYIKGIAVRETSHYWPEEALRAQAVVFRTYAVYSMRQFAKRDYDVAADTSSQVYGGRPAERYRITDAVDQTKGEVLMFGNEVLPAFFHSTCGGATAAATQVTDNEVPGIGAVVCGYCKRSPYWMWELALKKKEIETALRKKGFSIAAIADVRVLSVDSYGRASLVKITTASGPVIVKARDLRASIGPERFKSTLFSVRDDGDRAVFTGRGWGHGVGLCQWGAYEMAKQGFSYKEILSYYYPGSVIIPLRELSL
jgi:stage II sporulation protein D